MRKIKPQKDKFMTSGSIGLKKSESKPVYPQFSIDLQHIPEAKDWKVGDMVEVEMKLKVVGISQSKYQNNAEFEIHEIETEPTGENESTENEADDTKE